ncbi:inner-membrane translocator [Streptomyces sp. NPDC002328]|uniref:inner-membrane translocator n=1 Tax=Streptomyces sp. NPDC002328 TaxID=3364642 RepID=UPI0036D0BF31
MPELADKQRSSAEGALTAGCLLFLVLVADVAAGLLVAIVLAVRGPGRTDTGSGRTAAEAAAGGPAPDWSPVLGFGVLALAAGATAVLLLRGGHRVIGTVQLAFCAFLAVHTLGSWP